MSQFRIKKIDTGIIDEWVFRINDQGIIVGDDVVAEDPNELAQAVSDTQHEILKSGIYSPGVLIHTTEGSLSRIKTIEDTFGSTTLQDAYNNGRFISVAAGRPLSLGAIGEIELDSSGNLKINPNTFKITNGVNDMFLSEDGVRSSNSDLTFGTTSAINDTLLTSGRELQFKDLYLTASIALSESGETGLSTTAQSIIGAINEISGSFAGTDFQQIYDQSAPATVTTSFGGGPVNFINGSGNPNTPALIVDGGISTVDFLDADKLTVGPGAVINITIDSDGSINALADIETATKLISPRLENSTGELTFLDSRGSTNLTQIGEGSLGTVNQSIFGSINEVNSLALVNASNLAVLDIEHDLVTGKHEIITTQSAVGFESTDRFLIKDGSAATKISMNALGEIIAESMTLDIYDVNSELATNVAHRADDGSGHSAVASHFAASNPHNVVKTFAKFGDTALSGDVTVSEGAGITLTRVGNDIVIATSAGNTLQSVYDSQANGDFVLDTTSLKNLKIKDSASALIGEFKLSGLEMSRNLSFISVGAAISSTSGLDIDAISNIAIGSSSGSVSIDSPTLGQTTTIEGIPFTDGAVTVALDPSITQDIVGGTNDLAQNHVIDSLNATGTIVLKGLPVILRSDGSFWIPYPDPAEAGAVLETPPNSDLFWHVAGVADEDIAVGAIGRIRMSGKMRANVGEFSLGIGWRPGDALYVARVGYSEAEIVSIGSLFGSLSNNDTITLDTVTAAKVYTAKSSGASSSLGEFNISGDTDPNAAADITRNNLIDTLNNETYMDAGNDFFIRAFLGGEAAKGRALITGAGTPGDTVVLTPGASIPGAAITLVAVAFGTTPSWLQYELGNNAAETAIHLADAITRTFSFDGPDPQTAGNGHNCFATAYGEYVDIKWAGPGKMGNSVVISDTSAAITSPGNLTGGTSVARLYRSERAANGLLCSESNATGMTCSDFIDDEGLSSYMNQTQWFSSDRLRKDDDRRIKVARVVEWADPFLTFMVEPEAPRKNRTSIKGVPYDTEY
jgi:hypothetical protein